MIQDNIADRAAALQGIEPLRGPLTLNEALARALKYNLDRRVKMMEEALALGQVDLAKIDMLPKVLTDAGYNWRSNDRISESRNSSDGSLSPSRFVSQDRAHETVGLQFTWSLLDLGLGYFNTLQQADRALVASERRRKAMHLLMHDVRTAYWRAASAQKLRDRVKQTIADAEGALKDSRRVEADGVRSPLDAMRYQRQLLETLRLLEGIKQELSSAELELAGLIVAPVGRAITIANDGVKLEGERILRVPNTELEKTALANNPDLREAHYNSRIARTEVNRTIAKLFPNLSINVGPRYDSDNYLVHKNWQEAGLQISYNLLGALISGPAQIKIADAGVALADQRRVAMQMAVVLQMHLARLSLVNATSQFVRADAIYLIDEKISGTMRDREQAQTQSKLETVSNSAAAILSLLRRYQAMAQVQSAESKLMANLGLEPQIGSVEDMSLPELSKAIGDGPRLTPELAAVLKPVPVAPPVPKVRSSMCGETQVASSKQACIEGRRM